MIKYILLAALIINTNTILAMEEALEVYTPQLPGNVWTMIGQNMDSPRALLKMLVNVSSLDRELRNFFNDEEKATALLGSYYSTDKPEVGESLPRFLIRKNQPLFCTLLRKARDRQHRLNWHTLKYTKRSFWHVLYKEVAGRNSHSPIVLMAVTLKQPECAKELILSGADLLEKNKLKETALYIAIKSGDRSLAEFMVGSLTLNKQALDSLIIDPYKRYTLMTLAAQYGQTGVIEILYNKGCSIGSLSLMTAARNGHTETVQKLVELGAEIDAKNDAEWTALHYAAQNGHTETVQKLVEVGATVNVKSKDGVTPLMLAAQDGHTEIVQILVEQGAEIDAKNNYEWTALNYAAQNGHTETAQKLVELKATIDVISKAGNTPLKLAARNSHTEIVQKLAGLGADINASDNDGWSPLMSAVNNNHLETVKILIELGANVNMKNAQQATALTFATNIKNIEMLKMLLRAGAQIKMEKDGGARVLNYMLDQKDDLEMVELFKNLCDSH